LSHTSLFQVMVAVQNAAEEHFELPGLTVTPLDVEGEAALFDLSVSVEEIDTELAVLWEYNTALFDAGTIARMATHFLGLLEAVTAQPDQPLAAAPLV